MTIALFGYFSLVLSCLASIINLIIGFKIQLYKNQKIVLKYFAVYSALLSFIILAFLMATGDTSIKYVVEHIAPESSKLIYKIAAVWAGQAGGLLLWAVELALISLAIPLKKHPGASLILSFIMTALTGMVILNNPFTLSEKHNYGGLNPVLQDKMMLIHPPMLFLGYALLAIPFAISLGSLIENNYQKWQSSVKPWLILSALALTAGNGFGAIWAYRTFGWGGFWSWDPVENTSFVPWILSIASLHALHLSKYDGKWLRPAIISSIAAFITVIYGSFLARSGLLAGASVHAYVKGEQLLLVVLSTLLITSILSSLYFLCVRWNSWYPVDKNKTAVHHLTKLGTVTLFIIAIIVLIGMTLPVFHITARTEIYNLFIAPCALIFSIFMFLQFKSKIINWSVIPISLVTIFIAMPEWVQQDMHPLMKFQAFIDILLLAIAITIIFASFFQLINKKLNFSAPAFITHFGLMLILIGTIISGHQNGKAEHYITEGTSFRYAGEIITVNAVREEENTKYIDVSNQNKIHIMSIKDDKRFNISLRNACIIPIWWGDIYITPQEILTQEIMMGNKKMTAGAMITVTAKPAIKFVWIGLIIIACGLLLTFFKATNQKSV